MLTAPEAADAPELAVVSAVLNGGGPDGVQAFTTLLESLENIEPEQARSYIDEVLAVLPKAARKILEAILETRAREYKSDFARRYYGQGKAEGEAVGRAEGLAEGKVKGLAEAKANAVLMVLAARGVAVSEPVQVRVSATTDLELLDSWVRRAATVQSADELFDPR